MRSNFNIDGSINITAATEEEKSLLKNFSRKFHRGGKLILSYDELTNSAKLGYTYFINGKNLLRNGFEKMTGPYYGKFFVPNIFPNPLVKVLVDEYNISGAYWNAQSVYVGFNCGFTIDSLNLAIKALIDGGFLRF